MFAVGQRVLLPDGRATGILVGQVKATKNGLLENIIDPQNSGTDVVDRLWNVHLEGYFMSDRKDKPLVVQVPEENLHPIVFNDPFAALNYCPNLSACPLCDVQLRTDKSATGFKSLDDIIKEVAAANQSTKGVLKEDPATSQVLAANSPALHPIYPFACCFSCESKLLECETFPFGTCSCCGILFTSENEERDFEQESINDTRILSCNDCSLSVCQSCAEGVGSQRQVRVYFTSPELCVNCYYKMRLKTQKDAMKITAYKQSSKSLVINEKRRDVLVELELGEKIYPDHENNNFSNKMMVNSFMAKDNLIDFSHKAFLNESYFQKKNLKLFANDLRKKRTICTQITEKKDETSKETKSESQDNVIPSLYIETYFYELHKENHERKGKGVSDERGQLIPFYSEYNEKYVAFRYISSNQVEVATADRRLYTAHIQKCCEEKLFTLFPGNLDMNVSKKVRLKVILEGRSGEYRTYSCSELRKNTFLCELKGKITYVRDPNTVIKKYMMDKSFYLEKYNRIRYDCNVFGNISHFLQYTKQKHKANLEMVVSVFENEPQDDTTKGASNEKQDKYKVKTFLKTTKSIEEHTPLVVLLPC